MTPVCLFCEPLHCIASWADIPDQAPHPTETWMISHLSSEDTFSTNDGAGPRFVPPVRGWACGPFAPMIHRKTWNLPSRVRPDEPLWSIPSPTYIRPHSSRPSSHALTGDTTRHRGTQENAGTASEFFMPFTTSVVSLFSPSLGVSLRLTNRFQGTLKTITSSRCLNKALRETENTGETLFAFQVGPQPQTGRR